MRVPTNINIASIISFISIKEIRIISFDINPRRGGSPPRDRISEIGIILFIFVC